MLRRNSAVLVGKCESTTPDASFLFPRRELASPHVCIREDLHKKLHFFLVVLISKGIYVGFANVHQSEHLVHRDKRVYPFRGLEPPKSPPSHPDRWMIDVKTQKFEWIWCDPDVSPQLMSMPPK